MKANRTALLTLAGLLLASCSFEIRFSSSAAQSSDQTVSSAEKSSVAPATSYDTGGVAKTPIKQRYTDYTENNIYPIDSAPTVGNCKILVIPVWFKDSDKYVAFSSRDKVREDIAAAYFGTEEETGWHSVKSFYETESCGKLSISGTVSEWYEPGTRASTYYYQSVDDATSELVVAASDWYFENNPEESRLDYDSDSDGYLDGVMLIYAAPDHVTWRTEYDNMWAYCYWIQNTKARDKTNPGVNTYFWASFDFMYGTNTVLSRTGKSYAGGNTSHCKVDTHTYVHEMGHVFGLDDYYDYGDNKYLPAGGFSMQDYNVGGHDPFSTMAFGWSDPYIPTESCTLTIGSFQKTRDCVLLTPKWNSFDSPFDEYLLLELYTPTGLNQFDCTYSYAGSISKGPSAVGIRLWHVDARLLYVEMDEYFSAAQITSDANYDSYYGVVQAFSNTTGNEDYGSPLGSKYDNYNLLQLIRNNTTIGYHSKASLGSSDLFKDGDSFAMDSFGKQFVNKGKLNSGNSLGWSFSVSISGTGDDASATLTLVRE